MKKITSNTRIVLGAGLFSLLAFSAHAIDYGLIFGYAVHEPIPPSSCNLDGIRLNIIQVPQFRHWNRDDMGYWYSQVEEAAFANVKFIALNSDGNDRCGSASTYDCTNPSAPTPVGNTPTCYFANARDAINTRGYQNTLKVALFDDTGSYYKRLLKCDPNAPNFDLGNTDNYWYFWEGKWKPYFDPTNPKYVPDANRFKVGTRPVVFLYYSAFAEWLVHPGDKQRLIAYLRTQCATLGVDPFIIADQSWYGDGAAIDAYDRWFSASEVPPRAWGKSAYAGQTWGAYKVGIATPGYYSDTGPRTIDRANGATYLSALTNASTGNGVTSSVVLVEALNGTAENVGIYRGSSICRPGCGSSTRPYDQCWSFPNQYLNITREVAFPTIRYIAFQAEGADSYYRIHNPNNIYRRPTEAGADELQVFDIGGNWSVRLEPQEWLEYQDVKLSAASTYKFGIRYAAAADATMDLYIDGQYVPALHLKTLTRSTNEDTYKSLIFSDLFALDANAHDIRLVIYTTAVKVDKWTLNAN